MSELLVQSVSAFQEIVLESLRIAGARRVVEVGADCGEMVGALLDYTRRAKGRLVAIDPVPSPEAVRLLESHPHAELVRDPSLSALPGIDADAYVIDGDHNWYTVYHETQIAWERTRTTETPFLAFYHDVGWPWGRRDLYYDPARIPRDFLRPHSWDRGVTLGHPGLVDGGFRGEGHWACAREEGGGRNGVLTAIEDFVLGKEEGLAWGHIPGMFGLGVLFESNAPWAGELATHLLPYHLNPLLERLERNRLECSLRAIALQDSRRAQAA